MPIYESICRKCGSYHEYFSRAAECHNTPTCCELTTEKVILSAPAGIVDIPAYESPASGKMITSRAQRREDFKRTGTRAWEGIETEKQERSRIKAYDEKKDDEKLDTAVRTAWGQLSPEKKALALKAA